MKVVCSSKTLQPRVGPQGVTTLRPTSTKTVPLATRSAWLRGSAILLSSWYLNLFLRMESGQSFKLLSHKLLVYVTMRGPEPNLSQSASRRGA
jgi:hypothetical protein